MTQIVVTIVVSVVVTIVIIGLLYFGGRFVFRRRQQDLALLDDVDPLGSDGREQDEADVGQSEDTHTSPPSLPSFPLYLPSFSGHQQSGEGEEEQEGDPAILQVSTVTTENEVHQKVTGTRPKQINIQATQAAASSEFDDSDRRDQAAVQSLNPGRPTSFNPGIARSMPNPPIPPLQPYSSYFNEPVGEHDILPYFDPRINEGIRPSYTPPTPPLIRTAKEIIAKYAQKINTSKSTSTSTNKNNNP